ncbi:MAG: hypothetical protein M1833_003362 [Piccolia ochrophora]|nr:MAG: hypothetical protein M1833_003362 [Piccolia ochrophora]
MRLSVINMLCVSGFGLGAAMQEVPEANYTSPNGVGIYNPETSIDPSGPWSLMSIAGDTVYIAGMRGIFPTNNTAPPPGYLRVKQAFLNMQFLAEYSGARLEDCVRLVVYVSDMYRYRPVVNRVQEELWAGGGGRYPPRTIVEAQRLNEDDICEVEGTFYLGQKGRG